MLAEERWKFRRLTLASGTVAYLNRACGIDLTSGKVKPMASSATLLYIGVFAEGIDATSGDKSVNVNLLNEVTGVRYVNGAGAEAVHVADVGNLAWFMDDQTVSISEQSRSLAGRIWDVDPDKGVLIERLQFVTKAEPAY